MTAVQDRLSVDACWLEVASTVARRSACTRSQVGAAIVTAGGRLCSTGYNGPPAGLNVRADGGFRSAACRTDCPRSSGEQLPNNYSNCISIHAEINALLFCDRTMVEGGTVYVTRMPCFDCAKAIANSGASRLVVRFQPQVDAHNGIRMIRDFLLDCGLRVEFYDSQDCRVLDIEA